MGDEIIEIRFADKPQTCMSSCYPRCIISKSSAETVQREGAWKDPPGESSNIRV